MQYRTSIAIVIALLLSGASFAGCSREQAKNEERRRALLKPSDFRQQREQAVRKQQLVDTQGELVPSDDMVAGIALPRGFTPVLKQENKWYFRSTRVPFAALDRYFAARLLTGDLDRGLASVITFANAHIKDNSNAPRITVRLTKLSGIAPNEATEIFIVQDSPTKRALTPAEAEALALERRKFPR